MSDQARLRCVSHGDYLVFKVLRKEWLDARGDLKDVSDAGGPESVHL